MTHIYALPARLPPAPGTWQARQLTLYFNARDALRTCYAAYSPDCLKYASLFWPIATSLRMPRVDFQVASGVAVFETSLEMNEKAQTVSFIRFKRKEP